MPRFSAVVSLVLGTFLLAVSAQTAAARPLDLPAGQPILFALQSEAGSFERAGRGRFTLTLRGVVPRGVWFTDRPARDSGSLRAGAFFRAWRALGFHRDPPNAVLAVPAGRRRARAVAVELGTPRWNARAETVTFRARVLRRATGGLSHLDDDLRGGVPARFRGASLFVDDVLIGAAPGQCDYMGQLDMFPADGQPLARAYLEPGQTLPVSQYTALYSLFENTFGGEGTTTFALPNPTPLTGMRYGLCDYGIYPARADYDPGAVVECTTGSLSLQAQTFTAAGWVPADGRTLPIQGNRDLFAALGTTFGGDGTRTFAVPNVPGNNGSNYYVCANGQPFQADEPTDDQCYVSGLTLFATRGLPSNYMAADGRSLQIAQQQILFVLYGTAFGGDGQRTFNLPNFPGPVAGTTWGVCSTGVWPS